MSKRMFTAIGVVLMVSTCVFGQTPATPLPPPVSTPIPLANETPQDFDVDRAGPALAWENNRNDVVGQFTVGAEYLLWVFPKRHDTADEQCVVRVQQAFVSTGRRVRHRCRR